MADRSYLRDHHSPRTVDPSRSKASSRRQGDSEESRDHRSRHESAKSSPRKESNSRRKTSSAESPLERPGFELDVVRQPQRVAILGTSIEISALLSLRTASPNSLLNASNVDVSKLMAVATLVGDGRNGERTPLEADLLEGQRKFDNVRPLSTEAAESLVSGQPCRLPLGYFSFPDLIIRRSGKFRIRVTLLRMSSSGSASSILSVDSEPIRMDRGRCST